MSKQLSNEILLVGNPNVGKSVIFSYLTGRYAMVSNYPGTTVEVSEGHADFDKTIEVTDTPGVNSLFPQSEDEKVTRDILLGRSDATVVQVADAKNLFRTLLLTTQLAELRVPMVLVLNMFDEARQRGITIDVNGLSKELGIEVIETVAIEKLGLNKLVRVLKAGRARVPNVSVEYPPRVQEVLRETDRIMGGHHRGGLHRALSIISGDRDMLMELRGIPEEEKAGFLVKIDDRNNKLPNPYSYYVSSARKDIVNGIMWRTVRTSPGVEGGRKNRLARHFPAIGIAIIAAILYSLLNLETLSAAGLHPTILVLLGIVIGISMTGTDKINRLILHPVLGVFVLIMILYLVYMLVGVFAAGTLVDFLEGRIFGRFVVPALRGVLGEGWLEDFLAGEYGLVSMGLNYAFSIVLPIVLVFFLVFGILEDSGYFPRLTVLTNKVFKFVGVNGKATLPIVLGFGCVTMAVLSSRIMETRRDRMIVITILALAVPCSAQLGIIMALISAISLPAVLLLGLIILAEFVIAGRVMSHILGKSQGSDFILELPPLRIPKMQNIWFKTFSRVKWFVREAVPFFILATLILYVLDKSGGLEILYKMAEPVVVRFLGLPVESSTAFIIGFFRRDYGAAGLYELWENGTLSGNQVVIALTVISLFIPCLATLVVMIKEMGLRFSLAVFVAVIAVSLATGGILNLILNSLGVEL